MQPTYCYSCGAPVESAGDGAATLCRACQDGGPQLVLASIRWYLRPTDGRVDGPLGHEAVLERIASGKVGANDQVQRSSGPWRALAEHPDFRAAYVPGTEQASVVAALRGRDQARVRASRRRRRAGMLMSAGLMLGSLGLAAWSIRTRGLVFPEAWVEAADGALGGAREAVRDEVSQAVDEGAAAEQVARDRTLPGAAVIGRLSEKWPAYTIEQPLPLLLAKGRAALMQGTRASMRQARDLLEQAVVLAPADPEALGPLTEAYAGLVDIEPSLVNDMGSLGERTAATAPGSVAAERAAAWIGLVSGGGWGALAHAESCGGEDALAAAGEEPKAADFGCALVLAELRGDREALATLAAGMPGAAAIPLADVRVARGLGDWPAVYLGSELLLERFPDEAALLEARAESAAALGHWKIAQAAAWKALELEPHRIAPRHLLGELLLEVEGDAAAAAEVLATIPETAGWEGYPDRAGVYRLRSLASGQHGDWDAALEMADAALSLDSRESAASVARARALVRLGREDDAEVALRDTEHRGDRGREEARFHLGAAMLFQEMGRTRAAAGESDAALAAEPDWVDAHLLAASIRLEVGDLSGAVRHVLDAARADPSLDAEMGPRVDCWLPPPDWGPLQVQLAASLDGDLRLGSKAQVIDGILAWHSARADAEATLEGAVAADPADAEARGALGWLLVTEGRTKEALPHLEKAVALAPDWALVRGLYGVALARTGQAERGRAAIDEAIQSKQAHLALLRWKAEALMLAGDLDGARSAAADVLEQSSEDVGAWRLRLALAQSDG